MEKLENNDASVLDAIKDWDAPFWQEAGINNKPFVFYEQGSAPKWYWNLILSRGQVRMYTKHGMIPHRGWKITPVKKYFGVKGTAPKLLAVLEYLCEQAKRDE